MFPNKSVAYPEVLRIIRSVEGDYYTGIDVYQNDKGVLQHHFASFKSNDPKIDTFHFPKYYMLYKRDFFRTFLAQFPHYKEQNDNLVGLGESINKTALDYAIRRGTDWLLFIYESGKVYKINPKFLMKFCLRNNLIRTQTTSSRGELTYSFPISLLERYN